MACEKGHVEFLLDNGADINKQGKDSFSPLHFAIYHKHISACKLILEYEQVLNQNIESGITLSRIAKSSEIQKLLEMELKSRRKVILVSYSFNILLI
jgi:ankyrin repeat protein